MICNKSFQGRFVSGIYTPVVLLVVALAVWGCNTFVLLPSSVEVQTSFWSLAPGTIISSLLSLLMYVSSSIVLRTIDFFDRRLRFMPLLLVFLAVILPLPGNAVHAFSLFVYMLSVAMLFNVQQSAYVERTLFSCFLLLGIASLLLPQVLILLPMFVVFLFYSNIYTYRRVLSALLGLLTPFWLTFGVLYLFPALRIAVEPFFLSLKEFFSLGIPEFDPLFLLTVAMELLLYIPAIMSFSSSSVPSKPHLRRRVMFVMIMNIYLLFLSFFMNGCIELLCLWRVPGMAIMFSYIFSFKFSKMTNLHLILLNIVWIAITFYNIWLKV